MPGMTVLQCFCPRCGQPFSYDLNQFPQLQEGQSLLGMPTMQEGMFPYPTPEEDDEQPDSPADENGRGNAPDRSEAPAATPQGTEGSRPVRGRNETYGRAGMAQPEGAVPHGTSGRGCVGVALLAMLGCIAFVFIWSNYFVSSNLDTVPLAGVSGGAVHGGAPRHYPDAEDEGEPADTAFADMASPDAEAPDWIEGTWHADTDYGGIDVTISGNTISETTDGETCKGTFRYRNDALYCDYGDDTILEYKLDPERHRIDAGRGVYMEKVKAGPDSSVRN